jgi:flagellar motor switch protein FliM
MALDEHDSAAHASWLQGGQSDHSGLSIDRMPGIAFALEQFALSVPDTLAPLCKASTSGEIDELRSTTLFQFLGECHGLTAAVLNCAAFDARMLVIFDEAIADTLVTAIFSGEGEGAPQSRSRRPRTTIETGLIAELARNLCTALNRGFDRTASLALTYERLETLADVHTLGRRDMPAIAARVTIDTPGGPAPLIALFPQSLLLPIRKDLTFDPGSDAAASDPRWTRDMEARVTKTPVAVTAILDQVEMTLGEIAEFAIGQVLTLNGAGMGRVRLECAGREIFWCKLGEGDGRYSLKIEEAIVQESELAPAASTH